MDNINDKNSEKEYRYWTVEEIRPYIIDELGKRFPDSIIDREFDNVDLMIHGPNIPVEIQRTYIDTNRNPNISRFENDIRKQVEQNIEISGRCWLFFDAKLLHHLQNNLTRQISINLDWLYQFCKLGKVKLFTITMNGLIRELEDKDFEFIKNFSSTCKLSEYEEHRILEKNKSNIAYNILKGCGFTTEEINNFYNEFEKNNEGLRFMSWLMKKGGRKKELGKIRHTISSLPTVNNILKCNMKGDIRATRLSILGIIEGNENNYFGNDKYARIRYSDKYSIGYFDKKDLWDYWRNHTVDNITFNATIRGEFDYLKHYKNQKTIDDIWS